MRRAIAADFAALPGTSPRIVVTLDNRWADDPGSWKVIPIAPSEGASRLTELARAADYTVLIAPETTGILAGLTRELERAGARLLGSSPEAVELTGDKARLSRWFDDHGIATPWTRTIVPGEGLPDDVTFPAVLKPVDGAGSLDTFYLADRTSIPDAARTMPAAVLQPYQPGVTMSASFLVDNRRAAHLVGIGRQSMTIEGGRFRYKGGVLPVSCPSAEPMLRRAVQSVPGLRGFVGVDFLWDPSPEEVVVLEINPRPTTSIVALSRLLPAGWLAQAWLACCHPWDPPFEFPIDLSEIVHAMKSIVFDPSGYIRDVEMVRS